MIKYSSIKSPLLLLVLFSLLVLSPGMCSAAEISDQDLARLSTIFQQLETINNQQLSELETLKTNLMTDEQKLIKYQQALEKSQSQFEAANQELQKVLIELKLAQNSLEKVNQSFLEYSKQTKSEIRKVTLEKNVWKISTIAALLFMNR